MFNIIIIWPIFNTYFPKITRQRTGPSLPSKAPGTRGPGRPSARRPATAPPAPRCCASAKWSTARPGAGSRCHHLGFFMGKSWENHGKFMGNWEIYRKNGGIWSDFIVISWKIPWKIGQTYGDFMEDLWIYGDVQNIYSDIRVISWVIFHGWSIAIERSVYS